MTVAILGCASGPEPAPPVVEDPTEQRAAMLLDRSLDRFLQRAISLQAMNQRLRLAAAPLCEESVPVLGVALQQLDRLPAALRPPAEDRFGSTDRMVVVEELVGGTGFEVGDVLLSIGGRSVFEMAHLNREGDSELPVEVFRDGASVEFIWSGPVGCGYPAVLVHSGDFNAFADGEKICFTTAAWRRLGSDLARATVVGHELAHNIYDDPTRRKRTLERSRMLEARADHLGIYLAVLAGYDIAAEPDLAISMLQDINRIGERATTHPASPDRYAALRATLSEINERKASGLPLLLEAK